MATSGINRRSFRMLISVFLLTLGIFTFDSTAETLTGDDPVTEVEEIVSKPAWCDLPVVPQSPPQLKNLDHLPSNTIDRFWLSRLEDAGIEPAPQASASIQLRRLHYVLTGLPPTPEEVSKFLNSEDSDRWLKEVDRLLGSEQFGVHWARHWLDLMRWAETDGYERDRLKPHAWKYRDWVVNAFNSDMPYDRFLTEQLAGDEIPDESVSSHIATGFLHLGIRDDEAADPKQAIYNDFDSMLDTTCRSMLGISMGCARCHDHKGDPIPTRDYYRVLSFFEGLKPYDTNLGNAISTTNFTRRLPVGLGERDFEAELAAWKIQRTEHLREVKHLIDEVRARWGKDVFSGADAALEKGRILNLDFNTAGQPEAEVFDFIDQAPGRDGSLALLLNGQGHLSIPRPVQNDFTISFWFKTSRRGAGNDQDPRWFLGTGLVDGEINGVVNDFGISIVGSRICAGTGNPETFVSGPKEMNDDRWHHVCFTRQQSSGNIALWIDGLQYQPEPGKFDTGSNNPLNAPENLAIGRLLKGGSRFHGLLDDLTFWDRPLSHEEILNLYMGGGFLPSYFEIVEKQLGTPEALRMQSAVGLALNSEQPTTEFEDVLSAQEVTRPPVSHIRIRGNASVLGEVVTPGFPEFLGGQTATIIPPKDGESSGRRLALAKWITDPENPRTARVLVNRLWQHIFGSPLVGTPNDFGAFGLPPSHPRLLDAMATELVTNGWSMKYMIRQLVTSTAFRMSGEYNPLSAQLDPANELYWRFSGRRLSAEELRDSILAVSGNLNLKTSGPSVYPPLPKEVLSTSSRPGAAWGNPLELTDSMRRSIYIHVKRSIPHPLLAVFDLADTDASCPVRFNTVQPTQALTLLNSEFSDRQAHYFARRLEAEATDVRSKIRRALELTTQKAITENMIDRHQVFLQKLQEDHELDESRAMIVFCLMTLNLNEFVHLD